MSAPTVTRSAVRQPTTPLGGWGRTHRSHARLIRPESAANIAEIVRAAQGAIIPRGSGSSYGDAATRREGTVVDVRGMRRLLAVDRERGIAVVEAGMTLGELVAAVAGQGWVPPVLAGTPHVTLGGAVAADIHGKNHAGCGSFGRHVRWLVVVDATGETRMLTPVRDPEFFWATVGGMGLTGVITTVALQLLPCGLGPATVLRRRASDLPSVLDLLDAVASEQDSDPRLHAVAWLDSSAPPGARGRGLVQMTQVPRRDTSGGVGLMPRETGRSRTCAPHVPPSLPHSGVIGRGTIFGWNRARWMAPVPRRARVTPVAAALQPLRNADFWPALFGRDGLLQYQFVVPRRSVSAIGSTLDLLAFHLVPPALAVLKRMGPSDPAPLSFAMEGWTLALDLPARWPRLHEALSDLDRLVVEAGGKVYLAKDSRLPPATFQSMYPRLQEWQHVREQMDPGHAFASDLSRRLRLVPREVSQ